jgi:hypothetical protein
MGFGSFLVSLGLITWSIIVSQFGILSNQYPKEPRPKPAHPDERLDSKRVRADRINLTRLVGRLCPNLPKPTIYEERYLEPLSKTCPPLAWARGD